MNFTTFDRFQSFTCPSQCPSMTISPLWTVLTACTRDDFDKTSRAFEKTSAQQKPQTFINQSSKRRCKSGPSAGRRYLYSRGPPALHRRLATCRLFCMLLYASSEKDGPVGLDPLLADNTSLTALCLPTLERELAHVWS